MGVCVHSSGVYIVTEWIPNGDLTHLLKNSSVEISWKDRTQMLIDAAVAMRYLHAHSIIHRCLPLVPVLPTLHCSRLMTRHDTTRHDTTRPTTRHDTTRHDTTRAPPLAI
jgi:hypothetical protein